MEAIGAQPMFFLTWAHRDGMAVSGLGNYEAMQLAIGDGYTGIADELRVPVAPVWPVARAATGLVQAPVSGVVQHRHGGFGLQGAGVLATRDAGRRHARHRRRGSPGGGTRGDLRFMPPVTTIQTRPAVSPPFGVWAASELSRLSVETPRLELVEPRCGARE